MLLPGGPIIPFVAPYATILGESPREHTAAAGSQMSAAANASPDIEASMPLVLVVDDDEDIVRMLSTVLRKSCEVLIASNGEQAAELVKAHPIEAVVADHMMPGCTGVELLDRCHALRPSAARILVTASDRVQVLKEAVNLARVHRFVSKPLRLRELPDLVGSAIREARLEAENVRLVQELETKNQLLNTANERLERQVQERTRELQLAVSKLEQLALKDGLTGLYNHRYFQEALERELSRGRRHDKPVGLLFVDVDHFKAYNDRFGHPAGDRLLSQLAALLRGGGDSGLPPSGRVSDTAARYGGEEFVMLLPETDLRGCLTKAERVRKSVDGFNFNPGAGDGSEHVTVSIGVACFPQHAADKAALITAADEQLYRAKRGGRNRVCAPE